MNKMFQLFRRAAISLVLVLGTLTAFAQNVTVNGVIKDATNRETISGAFVQLQGSNTVYAISDVDGSYSINVPTNGVLVFSMLGYSTQEVAVNGRGVVNVDLVTDANNLDELVVIGYGTVRKRDLTGSVASVKEDVLTATPTANVMTSLQGRVAGLDIDGNNNMVIRGHRSINGTNDPLIIIDGVQGGSYRDVAPSDIQSVEVLKDASSTAIYGSQGANGVIIITTKKPDQGSIHVNYSAYAGFNMIPDQPERRYADTWIAPRRIAYKNAGLWNSNSDDLAILGTTAALAAFNAGQWTDYRDLICRNSFEQNHSISVSGGTSKTSARLTATWNGADTRRRGGHNDIYSVRGVIDHKVNDWLSAGVNMRIAHFENNPSPYQSDGSWQLGSPYDEKGALVIYPLGEGDYVNPLIDGENGLVVSKSHNTRSSVTGYLDLKPLRGLNFRTQLNANLSGSTSGSYVDKASSGQINGKKTTSSSMSASFGRYVEWNNILTYEREFGDHRLGGTLLTAWTKKISESLSGSGTNQNIRTNIWYALSGTNDQKVDSDYVQSQTFSYAGRINYSYLDRYLFTASIRRDGASMLAEGHKWAWFPSAAFAWRVIDEPWMEGSHDWLNDLKFRASFGVTGNSGIDPYGTQSGIEPFNTKLALQDTPLLHYDFTSTIGNTDTKWETSRSIDFGLDFSVLNGRISGVIDVYNTDTYDLLLARKLPTSAGADGNFTIMQNIGKTNNKGIELTLDAYPVRNENFVWKTTLTFARNIEKIVDLIDGNDIALSTDIERDMLMIGHPIKSYQGWVYEGLWKQSEAAEAATYFQDVSKTKPFAPGDYKLADQTDDNIIEYGADYVYLGAEVPDWYAGFNNTFNWKGFDLNVYMYFRWGQWGSNPLVGSYGPDQTGGSGSPVYDSFYYSAENEKTALFPALNASKAGYDYLGYTSLWFIDRSFFKIRNVSLGYTLPKPLLSKARISNCRFYVSAAHPLYYSKSRFMVGRDPEGASRNYIFGVEISF